MLLANVSGMRKTKLVVMTDSADRTSMPTMTQHHASGAEHHHQGHREQHVHDPALRAEAEDESHHHDERRGHRVAEHVMKMMVCTSTPGSRYWMYSRREPASAPPKM